MPLSFKSRLAKLEHKGQISQEEYQALIKKLDGHDKQIRADTIAEFKNFIRNNKHYFVGDMAEMLIYEFEQMHKEQK